MVELRRGPFFRPSGACGPSRGGARVDPAGVEVRAEGGSPESRPERIGDEERVE